VYSLNYSDDVSTLPWTILDGGRKYGGLVEVGGGDACQQPRWWYCSSTTMDMALQGGIGWAWMLSTTPTRLLTLCEGRIEMFTSMAYRTRYRVWYGTDADVDTDTVASTTGCFRYWFACYLSRFCDLVPEGRKS